MPLTHLICPDGQRITVTQCLTKLGCRMKDRCAPLPFIQRAAFDRKFRGVTPSMAGNGPRLIYLKATCPYSTSVDQRAFSVLGSTVHGRLGEKGITVNVLSEEKLSDDEAKGIADILEEDEYLPDHYILSDYKTSGSYKVMKWSGIKLVKEDVPVLDDDGKQVYLKSGPNKGQPKTRQRSRVEHEDPTEELRDVALQLNRYRIFYERYGFKVSRMRIFAIPRDGGTFMAKNRGIYENTKFIEIKHMPDDQVLQYYRDLQAAVSQAHEDEYARICNPWECWSGRRCTDYCEVAEDCKDMCAEFGEKWPGK